MINLMNIATTKEDLDSYELEHVFQTWSYQPSQPPLRVDTAKGLRFTDDKGRERLDFSSCMVNVNIGHMDSRVVDAICDQARKLCYFSPSRTTIPRGLLAKMLAEITPGDLSRSVITLGGTEANEVAIKIAHQFTGRRKIIARYRSYHGGTAASLSMSVGDARNWAQTLPAGTEVVPAPLPYCYRCLLSQKYPECDLACVKYIDQVIELEGGSDKIAALIGEPVSGANGVMIPPPEYWPEIRRVCDKWGVLLIADEVMTGFGRTGKWFAMDHWGVVPDIISLSKGITAGYLPLGATIVRRHIGEFFKNHYLNYGLTLAGHPLACACAVRVIQIYQEDNLIENSAKMGKYLLEKGLELKEKHPSIGDVRGLGLFMSVELVKNRKTREPLVPLNVKVLPGTNPKVELAKKLGELGMQVVANNPGSTVVVAPALIATRDDIDEGMAILDKALEVPDKYVEE
jgi:taurine--2-oxoglutarate transaminase